MGVSTLRIKGAPALASMTLILYCVRPPLDRVSKVGPARFSLFSCNSYFMGMMTNLLLTVVVIHTIQKKMKGYDACTVYNTLPRLGTKYLSKKFLIKDLKSQSF